MQLHTWQGMSSVSSLRVSSLLFLRIKYRRNLEALTMRTMSKPSCHCSTPNHRRRNRCQAHSNSRPT
ncbi:hypothetical protein BYT27DRAFT_6937102 [Phlegmacium glaucopus]|nr:hypothetical protein BYT27DRAFT_6937102 [Phlegmacium glaucopus]